ncbi:hypothetical protein SARC_17302, partial [Sphaeroforma arctica JP610]
TDNQHQSQARDSSYVDPIRSLRGYLKPSLDSATNNIISLSDTMEKTVTSTVTNATDNMLALQGNINSGLRSGVERANNVDVNNGTHTCIRRLGCISLSTSTHTHT